MHTTGGAASPATARERAEAFSLYAPWVQADPLGAFDELRSAGPIVRSEAHGGFWIMTTYEDIAWVARNPEIFSSREPVFPYVSIMHKGEKQIPLGLDGEEHRRWRQALSDTFSPGTVNHFEPQIQAVAKELVSELRDRSSCDFVTDFAVTLPAQGFLIGFGIGHERLQEMLDFKNWLVREAIPNAKSEEELQATTEPLRRFFEEAVETRRASLDPESRDVISHLLRARFDGRELTMAEMTNALLVSMLASLDTTTSALGLIWAWLATNPDERKWMLAHPEHRTRFIEELLRTQPVNSTARLVVQDVERHGVLLRAGDHVLVPWGMSGLDPAAFAEPARIDVSREPKPQLAFGVGPHRCLGMHQARRIISIAIQEWHAAIPDYSVTEGATPIGHFSYVRGLDSLPLTFG
jgi:cytochrome P450